MDKHMEEKVSLSLVKKAAKGNREAFGELIVRNQEYLYKLAYMYTKNEHDALDAVQECAMRAMISIDKLQESQYFKTWITRILINSIYQARKKNKKNAVFEEYQGVLFQDDYSYPGDFDSVAEKLEEPETKEAELNGAETAESKYTESNEAGPKGTESSGQAEENPTTGDMRYTKTNNGVTVSVSEAYCSAEAVYMSLMITSEEKFPETGAAAWDSPSICIKTVERYPFTDAEDPGYGFGYLEGDFLDEHTYVGIYRIDIADITQHDREKKEEFLSSDYLSMDFTITRIIGDKANPDKPDYQGKTKEELEAMTDEEFNAFMKEVYDGEWSRFPNTHEHWWYEGPFTFELDIAVDKENAQIVTVDERNETGAGLYSVSKTLFEVTVELNCSEERLMQLVSLVVLDADGKLLSRGSSMRGTTFVVGDRDVSKIYVYICDRQEYSDELLGYRESEDFRQILDERALYGREIEFH